jgi:hypothetical protein
MSDLNPSLIGLDKGLNLQTAKIVAPPGSVLDTLNYEQVDFQGQKRIDGFYRYDGSHSPALEDYYRITLTDTYTAAATGLVAIEDGVVGRVFSSGTNIIYVAVIDKNNTPEVGDELFGVDDDGSYINGNVVTAIVLGAESGATIEQHYAKLLEAMQWTRNNTEELPGSIIGLHWFRDRLYAVADVVAASLFGTTPVIYPNDVLTSGGDAAKVLDAFVLGNSRLVFLASMSPEIWATVDADVTRDSVSVGAIANGFEDFSDIGEIATFFESRSELQVLDEDGPSGPYDFGWRLIDQGWEVGFEDGISLYGSLPSLNQNITGIGTQGPTSTSGNNGLPLVLVQGVNITNKQVQVNGWKNSQTPLSYELETDNLQDVDDDTIYADAYISWNGTTTEVSAPGLTDDTLIEYPAGNTVVVDVT